MNYGGGGLFERGGGGINVSNAPERGDYSRGGIIQKGGGINRENTVFPCSV